VNRSLANGNGPAGTPGTSPAVPVIDDGRPLFDPQHWWRLA